MNRNHSSQGYGTLPVFLATICTILGAILFLRFGYAVAHTGFWGTIGIIAVGHIVTIATALAVAEIATNQKVEGGGAYYIVSRSFGLNVGASIGLALFIAQAISIAFYVVALGEAFDPLMVWLNSSYSIPIIEKRLINLAVMGLLTLLILTKGADLGVKALYVVSFVLFVSIVIFFAGTTDYVPTEGRIFDKVADPDPFFYVFTIIFPAFTGIAAGLGLSGDLREPRKSIPLGTISATLVGMVIYVFIAWKLTFSASPEDLANDQFIMGKISAWGPAIPIGLACAAISSALGSILIAPRTLQALGKDNVFPSTVINKYFARGKGAMNEPFNAAIITCLIAFVFVAIGGINVIAEIISMFFMVTYGAICLISFLEYFAADPSYRPTFKSHWLLSLVGAILCFWLMFKMNLVYAVLSLILMTIFYLYISYYNDSSSGLARIFKGVIFQTSRSIQVFLQKADEEEDDEDWRPAVICINDDSFRRTTGFDMTSWISYRYGFGTYIHLIVGYLSKTTNEEKAAAMAQLKKIAKASRSNVYLDTLVSPSFTSAIAQTIQLPGISGQDNNMILFEFAKDEPDFLNQILDNYQLIRALDFDVAILRSTEKGFGYKSEIHIWVTPRDSENANLMILLGFIIQGHPDWKRSEIKIMTIAPKVQMKERREEIVQLISTGRLPISTKNIDILEQHDDSDPKAIINEKSTVADLTILGFRSESVKRNGADAFLGYNNVGNILFVNTGKQKVIK